MITWTRGTSALLGAAVLAVIATLGIAPEAAEAAAAPTDVVLLAHGGAGNSSSFDIMAKRLREDGYRPFTIDFPFPATDTRKDAELLAERVREVIRQTGAKKIHLVGHSMGGIAARWYLTKLDGLPNVASYVAMGSPQHGNPNPLSHVLVPDQDPAGPVLRALNAGDDTPGSTTSHDDATPGRILYTSIGSTEQPEEADGSWSRLDGGACLPQVKGGSHAFEPSDPEVYAAVLDGLRTRCSEADFEMLADLTP